MKLGGYQWKNEQHDVRKWKLWVRFHLTIIVFKFVSIDYIGFIPAQKGHPGCAYGGHYLLLDCIYNCSLRWSTIVHVVPLQTFDKRFFLRQVLPWSKILPTMHNFCKKYGQNQTGI